MATQANTIFALSSGQGRAGIAVIRVSGAGAALVLSKMVLRAVAPRMAQRVRLIDPFDATPLDEAVVLWFPAPKSFTGEDVLELHVHGGRAVIAGVLAALTRIHDCRLAEPGEFTQRAFEHGKIDLTEAEGLADLIDAETEGQRQLAFRQLAGELHRAADRWRADLLRAQALVEAVIDFSDERDVPEQAMDEADRLVHVVAGQLAAALDDQHKGEILRDGFQVVIAGLPNVGKSSLINAISKREAAIVSADAGTTRDVVELHLNLGGLAVVLADTAGVRIAQGDVEREGIRRGLARARAADLVLWVVDAATPETELPPDLRALAAQTFWVVNKCDLVPVDVVEGLAVKIGAGRWAAVSVRTGEGLPDLVARIAARALQRTQGGEATLITTARHRQQIAAAAAALADYAAGPKGDLEMRAEDLRQASAAIGRLVGRVDAEEVLGEIFGRFCIGK